MLIHRDEWTSTTANGCQAFCLTFAFSRIFFIRLTSFYSSYFFVSSLILVDGIFFVVFVSFISSQTNKFLSRILSFSGTDHFSFLLKYFNFGKIQFQMEMNNKKYNASTLQFLYCNSIFRLNLNSFNSHLFKYSKVFSERVSSRLFSLYLSLSRLFYSFNSVEGHTKRKQIHAEKPKLLFINNNNTLSLQFHSWLLLSVTKCRHKSFIYVILLVTTDPIFWDFFLLLSAQHKNHKRLHSR